jgi:alpha-ketoglutarate-dependent taurine dioxygenase
MAKLRTSLLDPACPFPLLVEPESATTSGAALEKLVAAFHRERDSIEELLDEHGALLFRGFGVVDVAAHETFLGAARYTPLDYERGISPRHAVGRGVYISTEAPPRAPIPLHNEMSYSATWPEKIAFSCERVPQRGGETPIADMAAVCRALPSALRDEFSARGLRYVQRVPLATKGKRQRSWPEMFASEERAEVEQICAGHGLECEWQGDGSVRLTNERPAILRHPRRGEELWFNQAHVFHPSFSQEFALDGRRALAAVIRGFELLERVLSRPLLPFPYAIRFADGGPIPDASIGIIRRTLHTHRVSFPWQRGDLLLLDNLRMAHGRSPFEGERRVLASLIAG